MSVAKSSYALKQNIQAMLDQYGIERIGFLTLTFQDDVQDIKEANARLNSLMSHFLRSKLVSYILIRERQKRGTWHFHLLVVLPFDIKSKGKFTRLPKGGHHFTTKNVQLIQLWRDFREAMPRYGFGRHELLPVRKDSKAVAAYLSKYIGKHMSVRKPSDKGVRLISYCQSVFDDKGRCIRGFFKSFGSPGTFSWHSPFCSRMRKKVQALAANMRCFRPEDAHEELGPQWGFKLFSSAAYMVQLFDIMRFNLAQADLIPWAVPVCFVDGQICRLDTGEVQF